MFIVFNFNKHKLFMFVSIVVIILILLGFGYKILADDKRNESSEDVANSKIINFIEDYGWKVNTQPVETEQFKIPKKFNSVYKRYNKYQKDIGKDLTKYRGKKVTRYTYKVLNYDLPQRYKSQQVYADIIVYNSKIIGGDLKTNELDGFMVSLNNRTYEEITG